MNAERLLNMVVRQVLRRLVNRGVDAGINRVASVRGSGNRQGDAAQNKEGRENARRAKNAMRLGRRIGKL